MYYMPNVQKKLKNKYVEEQAVGILTPQQLIRFVRENSPFYKNLYKDLPDIVPLKNLPILSQSEYRDANVIINNQILTGPQDNGLVFCSGGTSGNPKFSYITHDEWKTLIDEVSQAFAKGPIESGDRIANLFFGGSLYGAFVYTTRLLESCPLDLMQLPIAGHIGLSDAAEIMREFKANVIMSFPTTIMKFAEYVENNPSCLDSNQIEKIFFAGEPFFEDQKKRLKEIFPNSNIFSISYGSTDGGMLGYPDHTCNIDEFRIFGRHTILEIIDEKTHEVIDEENREGLIVITNLFLKLMPVIRYPVGDRGMWVEAKSSQDRKFKLLGRAENAACLGGIRFYVDDVRSVIDQYRENLKIYDFQMLSIHKEEKDCLILKIASPLSREQLHVYENEIISKMGNLYSLYREFLDLSTIHPLEIQWILPNELEVNKRTGKMRHIIDRRKSET